VLGANGQLGRALVRVLTSKEINHAALGSTDLDIRDLDRCLSEINRRKPRVVVNAAAWTNVDGAENDPIATYSVNTQGAVNLALAAKSIDSIFVQISTDYVFSGVNETPWEEKSATSPLSVYGFTKARAEYRVLEEFASGTYIFRTAWLYSPWGKNFAKTMTKLALRDDFEVRVVADQIGQPTYAVDLAHQIVETIQAKLPFDIYHATNSSEASWFSFAQEVFNLSGQSTSRVLPITSSDYLTAAKRPQYTVLGHEAWRQFGVEGQRVQPMRKWQDALVQAMPEILNEVKREISND